MKKSICILLLACPVLLSAQIAKIKIDIDRTISEIDPKIYGVFIHHSPFNTSTFSYSSLCKMLNPLTKKWK